MSKYLESLIFDRTQSDIIELTDKAYIDYKDLNRVEQAIKWVSYVLNQYGYRNTIVSKTWKPQDHRTDYEMDRLKKNIVAIRNAYYTDSNTPLTPDKITYTSVYQANAIERIIYDLGNLIVTSCPGPNHLAFTLGRKTLGNRSISL